MDGSGAVEGAGASTFSGGAFVAVLGLLGVIGAGACDAAALATTAGSLARGAGLAGSLNSPASSSKSSHFSLALKPSGPPICRGSKSNELGSVGSDLVAAVAWLFGGVELDALGAFVVAALDFPNDGARSTGSALARKPLLAPGAGADVASTS